MCKCGNAKERHLRPGHPTVLVENGNPNQQRECRSVQVMQPTQEFDASRGLNPGLLSGLDGGAQATSSSSAIFVPTSVDRDSPSWGSQCHQTAAAHASRPRGCRPIGLPIHLPACQPAARPPAHLPGPASDRPPMPPARPARHATVPPSIRLPASLRALPACQPARLLASPQSSSRARWTRPRGGTPPRYRSENIGIVSIGCVIRTICMI